MSATMDVDHFSAYFNAAPVLYLEGRQYPVQVSNGEISVQIRCRNTKLKLCYISPFNRKNVDRIIKLSFL